MSTSGTSTTTATQSSYSGAGLEAVTAPVIPAGTTVLRVGEGETYSTLNAAVSAAQDGDVILVDAGTYTNDFATVTAKISIIGVGGMANFVATEPPANLKGILTVDNDVTIENLSFSGAAIDAADGGNAAGIRYEGGQMSLTNDSFSNNQDGLLAAAVLPQLTTNTITINHSVFSDNGSGTGYTHNLYVGDITSLTATNSVFEGAVVGHEFKSRAETNTITNNVFSDGPTGTASYSIDLPDGGNDTVTGNLIEKGPNAENNASVHFGGEGIPYAGSSLTVSANDFVNDLGTDAVAVLNQTATTANITGNTFSNYTPGQIASGPAVETSNVNADETAIANTTLAGVLPGNTLIITDPASHTVTLNNALQAAEGGTGLLTVNAAVGHVTSIGGSGGMIFTESPGSGGNSITTAAGSTNSVTVSGQDLIDSEGNDTIRTGAGNITAQLNGTATVAEGYANNQWAVAGTATITTGGGSPAISVGSQGYARITGPVTYLSLSVDEGTASYDVTQGGAEEAATIAGGSVLDVINNGASEISTAAGSQGSTITVGAGTANVMSLGADTIYAGSGTDSVIVSGKASIYAGTGSLTVYGRGDTAGASIYANGGTTTFGGDTGNLTYYGGDAANTIDLQLSSNTLVGGAGKMTVNGGSRETITGGSGGIVYNASSMGGSDTITTAAGSSNTIALINADTVQSWGSDTITGGTGNQTINVYGNSTITGSQGNSVVTLSGTDTFTGVGQDNITVTPGAVATISAGINTPTTETGATVNYTVPGTSGALASASVTGGSANLVNTSNGIAIASNGSSAAKISLGAGTDTVNSAASDTVYGGTGTDTVTITAANTTLWGGSGALTVQDYDWNSGDKQTAHGGTGSFTYSQLTGGLTFIGGAGSAAINGGNGSLNITAGSGQISVSGGSAGTVFTAGSGSANVTLSSSSGTVNFGKGNTNLQIMSGSTAAVLNFGGGHGGGTDTIYGFRGGVDTFHLNGISLRSETIISGGYDFKMSDGTDIRLMGVSAQSLALALAKH